MIGTAFAQPREGPVISGLKVSPLEGFRGTMVTLRLKITDPGGAENIIPTLFVVRRGVEEMKVRIFDDGSHGDLTPGDGEYAGRLRVPPNASFQVHQFEVFVENRQGGQSNTLTYEFKVMTRGFDI